MRRTLPTRRDFIRTTLSGFGAALVLPGLGCAGARDGSVVAAEGWDAVPQILARIRAPKFPRRDFTITDFGALGDGTSDATGAIRAAIEACADGGGGRVVIPEGRFHSGPIHLRSNVNLHLVEGGTIAFSRNPWDYLPPVLTRFEGMELMGYSPLIYAYGQENIAVTGSGTLDGQADADHWWPWKGREEYGWREGDSHQADARDVLQRMVEEAVPASERLLAEESYLRPQFIQPYRCRNVLVEGIRVVASPMWEIHPVLCTNVTVRGVRIETHGPNNDGCNPESCTDVLIEDCYFDTGDDCIAIKSGRNAEGRRIAVPSSNIVIRNCEMRQGHGGVVIGSEMSGGVRNVFAENCRMNSPDLERALRIKTNSVRGGFVENVYMRDVTVGQVADAVFRVNFFYEEGDAGDHDPLVRNVELRGVTCEKSTYALYVRGYEDAPIRDVRLIDCHFRNVDRESVVEHVNGLTFRDVTINGIRTSAPEVNALQVD